uniref:ADAM metallopeptidase with thrombospondin type 1 motif 15 n=1 Tax=Anolis carolinensis TaxID=28377 RepID=H9GPK4_ANOCA
MALLLALLALLPALASPVADEAEVVTPLRLDRDPSARRQPFHPGQRGGRFPAPSEVTFQLRAFQQEFISAAQPGLALPGFPRSRAETSADGNAEPDSFDTPEPLRGADGGLSGVRGAEYLIRPLKEPGLGGGNRARWVEPGEHLLQRRRPPATPGPAPASRCGVASGLNAGALRALQQYKLSREEGPKRFVSLPRFVETLLVADESMALFHGADLTHYQQWHHLPRYLEVLRDNAIVLLLIIGTLNDHKEGNSAVKTKAGTVRGKCSLVLYAILSLWQDLCGATTCDTLGMADVGTMCDPKRSCSVIEDDGLPSAFTTAHELGHVFNMPHDNVKVCEEIFGRLKTNHMMSPTLIQIDRTNPWSACSAAIITDFLDSGHGDCLLDQPTKPIPLPEELPGTNYNLNQQCELAFGTGSKPCPYMQYCTKLWCTGKARGHIMCQTRHFPWADGTSCGEGKFCLKGICVERHNISKYRVDGNWGKWAPYGQCSRTCGGGVQLAKRECNDPSPTNEGKYCEGIRVKYRSCGLDPCSDSGKSFREEQCEAFNGYNHSTNRLTATVSWVPKYSGVSPRDKCKLICRANGTGYFYVLAPKVVDGTPCSPDSTSLCVQGKCIKAGCDGKLGSKKKFDKCGVCGGDNKSCKKVSGLFTKPMHGYNFVVLIPAGACSIDIRQRGYKGLISDDNYLAVKNAHGKYLLNGHFIVSAVERDLIVKGSVLRYSGTGTAVESLQAFMPVQEPLTIEVLSVGKMTPPRVRYSFYLPKESKEDKSLYRKDGKRPPVLTNSILSFSNRLDTGRPDYKRPSYKWATTSWEDCSVTCGNGLQKRMVMCRDTLGQLASACDATQRPIDIRICGDPCPTWEVSPWSSCSKTCGRGFKRRMLKCTGRGGSLLPRDRCNLRKKPQELDFCTLRPC